MKKTLLTLFCAFVALCGSAQTEKVYNEQLLVTINGETSAPMQAGVTVTTNLDGTINFSLKNFMLDGGDGNVIPVGNIVINNLPVEEKDGLKHFSYNDRMTITAGNMEGISADEWLGPLLGELPLVLKGKMNDEKLYVTIDIDLTESLGQVIQVQLGTDFPAPVAVRGDVNGDGVVTIADVVAVLEIMAAQ